MTEINPNTDLLTNQQGHGDGQIVANNRVSVQQDNEPITQTNCSILEAVSINRTHTENEMPARARGKSVYQRYETTVPKKQKNIIANIVSSLMIISLWLTFIIPSVWLIWAFADYFLYRIDPLSEETVSNIFKPESCPGNITIQNAIDELRRVPTGGFNTTNFTCVSTFVSNGTQCVPECLVWYPGGETYFYIHSISVPILSFVTLIAASIGASTWLFRKSLWKFPHIISLYLIVCVIGQDLMIFISSVDRRKFFCSSDSLFDSQINPTIQCQIQGPIYHYFILAFLGWYMCDIFNIIYVLLYPMKSVKFFAHSVKIHIIQSMICWGIPLLIIAILLAATRRYEPINFPIICLPTEYGLALTFYIPGVAFSLTTGTGLILLGLTLYKRHKKMADSTSTATVYQSLLRHMTIYSIALSVLIFIILCQFTFSSINYKITEAYRTVYLWCITAFYETPDCCFPAYEAYYAPFLTLLNEATFCCWGIVALSIVWVKEARGVWINILTCSTCRHKYKAYKSKSMVTGVSGNK